MKRRLGRGLDALIGGTGPAFETGSTVPDSHLVEIDVHAIQPNPFQPRKEFGEDELAELVESVRQHGVLQPLIVRQQPEGYQLVAGERRLLASQEAGLETVPCRLVELEDRNVFEVAIEENLKRKDLNVLEKAQAFKEYLERFGSTIEDLARRLSMNRSTVSNLLRLLDLAAPVQDALRADKITNGHARAMLSLNESQQLALCQRIQKESLSVRQTELTVHQLQKERKTIPLNSRESAAATPMPSNHVLDLQKQLCDLFGVKVEIQLRTQQSGKILIPFQSNDDFERILRAFRRAA